VLNFTDKTSPPICHHTFINSEPTIIEHNTVFYEPELLKPEPFKPFRGKWDGLEYFSISIWSNPAVIGMAPLEIQLPISQFISFECFHVYDLFDLCFSPQNSQSMYPVRVAGK
jgi:hypothetical protein